MVKSVCCARCSSGATARKREFSEQAYSMLLVWGEIDKDIIDAPICDECYAELRDLLIERADDAIEEDTVAAPVEIKRIVGIPTAKAEVIPLARASGSDLVEDDYRHTPKTRTARGTVKKEKVSRTKPKTQKSSSKKTETKSKTKSKTVSKSKVKTTTKPSKKVSSSKAKKPATKVSRTTKVSSKKPKTKPVTQKVVSTKKIKKRKVA